LTGAARKRIAYPSHAATGNRIGKMSGAVSAYDAMAAGFERQRPLPDRVAQSVRAAVLRAAADADRPRILDIGAGSGRFGWPFVAAGDDYVGVDLSGGMLRSFAGRPLGGKHLCLIQADGRILPFAAASFDAVLLIAVFGNLTDARPLIDEARRVLRPRGALIVGRTAAPEDGIDERLKQRLDQLLDQRMPQSQRRNGREKATSYLAAVASSTTEQIIASWTVERSPRAFLERHAGGARFSQLPRPAREDALRALGAWAETEFGTLDAVFLETHRFEMRTFRFAGDEG
jgi:ubiquinone/menaquinone biosynthesis C-methylase UbiE